MSMAQMARNGLLVLTVGLGALSPLSVEASQGKHKHGEWHDDRGGEITYAQVHRILKRAGYSPVLAIKERNAVYVAETFDNRYRPVRVRIDRWTGQILAIRFVEHDVSYDNAVLNLARENLRDLGFRQIELDRTVDGVFFFDAVDARGRKAVVRVARRSGEVLGIDYRGRSRDWDEGDHLSYKSERQIERIVRALGFETIVFVKREGECYRARAHQGYGPVFELTLNAQTGEVLTRRALGKWEY